MNTRKTDDDVLIHPKTLELLRDRAENDPDEQLRQWAREQLKMQNVGLKIEEEA